MFYNDKTIIGIIPASDCANVQGTQVSKNSEIACRIPCRTQADEKRTTIRSGGLFVEINGYCFITELNIPHDLKMHIAPGALIRFAHKPQWWYSIYDIDTGDPLFSVEDLTLRLQKNQQMARPTDAVSTVDEPAVPTTPSNTIIDDGWGT